MTENGISTVQTLRNNLNIAIDRYLSTIQKSSDQTDVNSTRDAVSESIKLLGIQFQAPAWTVRSLGQSVILHSVVRASIDLDLFNILCQRGPCSAVDLTGATGADHLLLHRFLRLLAAAGYVRETEDRVYEASPLTKVLTSPEVIAMSSLQFDIMLPIIAKVPEHLKAQRYQMTRTTPAEHTYQYDFYKYLEMNPDKQKVFDEAMRSNDTVLPDALRQYLLEEILDGIGPQDIAIVDVGGGQGQWLETVSSLPGRKIVQDIDVKEDISANHGQEFELMRHNFFTPQPVLGTRIYHLRYILHNFGDAKALSILRYLAPAFTDARSRLLINERVLPDNGCGIDEAIADMRMFCIGGMERSESQWRGLLEIADFSIVKIWSDAVDRQSIIECVYSPLRVGT